MQPDIVMNEPDRALLASLMRRPTRHMVVGKGAANQHGPDAQRLVRRLKESNAYAGWRLEVDRKAMGMGVTAFVFVRLKWQDAATLGAFRRAVESHPQLMRAHILSGEYDFMLEVVGRDTAEIDAFRASMVTANDLVQGTRTMISLE